MSEIILYTTHCPRCNVLKKKLEEKKIPFREITEIDEMTKLGIQSVPVLSVDNNLLSFTEAVEWVNKEESEA